MDAGESMSAKQPVGAARKRIGPFTVKAILGEGGMGTVYRASRKGEDAAVKVIRPTLLDKPDIRERFEREAQLLQTVDNPHVARIIGFDATKKSAPWLATEYIDGPSLKEWSEKGRKLSEDEWSDIAEGVLSGLAAIHEKGIIHRDIKPANVMMSDDGPKIIDFGISKEEGQTALTQTQMFAGTVAYLAPERADGRDEAQSSDVYSAGLTLAYAAKGEHPWGDETSQSELSLLMKMSSEPPSLQGLSERQRDFLLALLDQDPERRPTASDALDILRGKIAAPVPVRTREMSPAKQSNLPRVVRSDSFRRPVFETGYSHSVARGLLLGLAPFILLFLVATVTADPGSNNRISDSAQIAAWFMSNSVALFPTNFISLEWLFDADFMLLTDIAIRPSLISIALIGMTWWWGRKYSSVLAELDLRQRILLILSLLLPIVAPAVAVSWIFAGTIELVRGDVVLSGLMPWDALFGLIMVGLGFLLGLMSGPAARSESTAKWWIESAKRFSLLLVAVLLLVSLGGAIYTALSPDFASAVEMSNNAPLYDRPFGEYARLFLWVLLMLPSLLALYSSAVLSLQAGFALRADDKLFFEMFSVPAESGVFASVIPRDYLFLAGAVVLIGLLALISGAVGARRARTFPVTANSVVQSTILSAVVGVVGFLLLRTDLALGDVRGSLFAHASQEALLVSAGVIFLAAILVTGLMVAGGLPAVRPVVTSLFTRLADQSASTVVTRSGKRIVQWPKLGGVAIMAAFTTIVLVAPAVIGSAERSLALQRTPMAAVSEFAGDLEVEDADGLKALFGSQAGATWLPDSALESAQPSVGGERSIELADLNGQDWQVGELGASATVNWLQGESDVAWDLGVETTIERQYRYLRVPSQSVIAEPVRIVLSQDRDLANVPEARLRVNNQAVRAGEYLGIPGNYRVERNGVLLLAPFSTHFGTSGNQVSLEIPSQLNLPAGADSELDDLIQARTDNCGTIFRPNCYEAQDIDQYQEIISGRTPSSYYDRSNSGLTDGGIKCWEPEDTLLSSSEMQRRVKCEQTVTSRTVYYDSRSIAEPVYSQRCARYSYSFWFGFYCSRYETYQSGTNYRTVRGGELATVNFRSEVPFYVTVSGSLDDAGEFQVSEATIE